MSWSECVMAFSAACQRHMVVKYCCGRSNNVGVVGTVVQLFMVHIVECSCQIERDEYCLMSRLFS